jgi:hypothetical protein
VVDVIGDFPFEISGICTQAYFNILPIGSYDVLLGMESHKENLNCYEKTLECEEEEGNEKVLQGIRKPVSVRKISALQLKNFSQKGFPLYAIQVLNSVEGKELKAEDHLVLWEFKDVFQKRCLDYLLREILIFQ